MDTETIGRVLADLSGHTLYYDTEETAASLTCFAECATIHRALTHETTDALRLPAGLAGALSLVPRPDGSHQVAYNGAPLYTFTGDQQPGDVTGAMPHWQPVQPEDE
jgi:predicted lipoprotein with Yx(FWY)xxD motif